MSNHEISFNTRLSDPIRTRADFIYNITPAMISISDTGLDKCSVGEDIEAVLRKVEYWHQGHLPGRQRILARVHWDTASLFALRETDQQKPARRATRSYAPSESA
jgi:hypothetical protein